MLKIEYENSIDDLINLSVFHYLKFDYNSKKNKNHRFFSLILYPTIIPIVFLMIVILFEDVYSTKQFFGIFIVSLFIYIIIFLYVKDYQKRNTSKTKLTKRLTNYYYNSNKKEDYSKYYGEKLIDFQEEMIVSKSKFIESKSSYEVIKQYFLTEDYLFIYESSECALLFHANL